MNILDLRNMIKAIDTATGPSEAYDAKINLETLLYRLAEPVVKHEVFTYGAGGGESDTIAVCEHGQPTGWHCHPCGQRNIKAATKPDQYRGSAAGPKHHVLYRAVCNCCGLRSWVRTPPPLTDNPSQDVWDSHFEEAVRARTTA